ncbi:MAG: fibronectin type III domain-containing protein [Pseudomonadota bacterium]
MLISRKRLRFCFFLLLISFFTFSCQNTENSPPVPGVITHFTDVTSNTMVMHWTRAGDADTFQPYLEYKVLASNRNNLDTLANALANGRVFSYDDPETEEVEAIQWNRDITSLYLSFVGFADGQTYYFTVIVRDAAWRQSAYPMASQKTIDITPPVIGGEITIVNETDDTLGLEWPAATDNGTDQDELEYKVVSSSQDDNIDTVSGAENSGNVVQDWATIEDGQFPVMVNIPDTINEFFNILVRDSNTDTANISVYKAVSRKPTPGGLGRVTAEGITTDSCTLTWEPATDFRTAQTDLLYKVVQSGREEPVLPWSKNIKTVNVTGLNSNSSYTFSVSVQDEDGYEVAYSGVQVRTLEESSQTQSSLNRGIMSLPEGSGGVFSVSESLGSKYDDTSFADMISPLEIAGNGHLVVWLDGADISGTNCVYEGPVSIWKDKSGMGNHAEQVIAGQQPVSACSTLFDNKRVLRFDAGNRNHMIVRLGADLDIAKSLEGYTVFLVAGTGSKIPDNLFSEGCYFVGKDDSSDFLGLFDENHNGDFKISVKTGLDQLIGIPDPPSLFVASLAYEQSNHGSGVVLRIGDASSSSSVFTKPGSIHEILLGAFSSDSGFFDGELAEFIIFDRVLKEDEHQRMNQYLEKKWGIQEPDSALLVEPR